ncbi:site-specific integrase [Neorhizobium galegae]|uniref:Site-specific integrase n=1 Tax=Neorhizobium galegae TaxID=399 RepID=A0A6A1TQB8_NEOGA|nr:site-specific integrase [Neorhizobium galegae]KAB1086802.1 site-specific integrase [Neorhizobium galegae]
MSAVSSLTDPGLVSAIDEISNSLPPLPTLIRYYDDFQESTHTIRAIANGKFIVETDGVWESLSVEAFGLCSAIYTHVVVDWFGRLDTTTVVVYHRNIRSFLVQNGAHSLAMLSVAEPYKALQIWTQHILPVATASQNWAIRAFLHSLCRLNIGAWSSPSAKIVRSLAGVKVDKYRVVRTADCFLPIDQQTAIANYIDDAQIALSHNPSALGDEQLRDVCMLAVSFQYALRPGQLARIELADVRIYETDAVHFSFIRIKQSDAKKRIRLARRIKREWCNLFVELVSRRERGIIKESTGVPARLLFGLKPSDVSVAISNLTEELTGEPWTPTDLRHTGAQRLADAGASRASLTEYLGHASKHAADVYYDNSPVQGQRINEALAISPIYANVAKISSYKTITESELRGLKGDNQVGAAPHGIPMAGIGSCQLGQSLCLKNPGLSCYTCSKFMPLANPSVHKQALEGVRPVVLQFAAAARGNAISPAYVQLRAACDAMRRVVEGLDSDREDQE